jgi:ribosomal protein L22
MAEEKKDTQEKPKRRARKKPAAEKKEAAPKKKAAAKKPAPKKEETPAKTEAKAEKPKPKRRGAAEVAAAADTKAAAKRTPEGDIAIRAQARYVRIAPRKARLVVDHIRGKSIDDARAILTHTPRGASEDVLKLLNSAVSNAENNHELLADELKIGKVFVDEGPTIKRYRPRALGRATPIHKRTSHMTVVLTAKES